MRKRKNKTSVQETRDFLNRIRSTMQMLSEAYVYDEMEQGEYEDEEPTVDPSAEEEGKEYVDAIRQAALKGIQYYAQDVDNPSYIFFKKVFMMADKVLSEKDENGSDSNV